MTPGSPIVLITGASRGIGAATARLAAQRGYAVCVNFRRDHDAVREVVASIEGAGGRAVAVAADVGSEADLCAGEAVRRMATGAGGGGGAIVNVSSVAARLGAPGEYVDYAASKGALDTMTVGLAQEVAADGIRVNAVRAGYIYTGMHASGGEPDRVDRVKSHVPMKRGGRADEVARAILWLLSGESSFTTGSFVDVAGGR